MSRPPRVEKHALIDVHALAHAGGSVERRFQIEQLSRLSEAGIVAPADFGMAIRSSIVEGRVGLAGELSGFVTMTCQRCMRPVKVDVADRFELLLVADEGERIAHEDRSDGYEPVVAEPTRLNLNWLAEEQILLSVPLIAKHADVNCASGEPVSEPVPRQEDETRQRPFANLKRLLRDPS